MYNVNYTIHYIVQCTVHSTLPYYIYKYHSGKLMNTFLTSIGTLLLKFYLTIYFTLYCTKKLDPHVHCSVCHTIYVKLQQISNWLAYSFMHTTLPTSPTIKCSFYCTLYYSLYGTLHCLIYCTQYYTLYCILKKRLEEQC